MRRDAPRDLDLNRLTQGVFQPVTSNNLTLSFVEPFVAMDGMLSRYVHYNLGVRQEEVWMDNQDVINPQNSFNRLATLTLPKGTLTLLPPDRWYFRQWHSATARPFTPTIHESEWAGEPNCAAITGVSIVISKTSSKPSSMTLRRVSNSQDFAKIDADTGLQEIEGPSLNRVAAVSLQQNFSHGSLFASYAQADARDVITGEPIPEAPRAIWDVGGTLNRLPLQLQLQAEVEHVRANPLGDGSVGVPVAEFRAGIMKSFLEGTPSLAATFQFARGYTGQTTETLALPNESEPFERIVGVPLSSYLSLSWTWRFGK